VHAAESWRWPAIVGARSADHGLKQHQAGEHQQGDASEKDAEIKIVMPPFAEFRL
jgi:hypothetical protein